MAVFKRERAFVDVCLEMLHDDSTCNLTLSVPDSGEPAIPVHQAFVCQLGPLIRDCLLTIGPEVEVVVLFPEFTVDEVKTLVSFLYRGQEGQISQSLAHAMGLTVGGHGIKGLLRNSRRRTRNASVAAAAASAAYFAATGDSSDDEKKVAVKQGGLLRTGGGAAGGDINNGKLEPNKYEVDDIKLELADYDENDEGYNGEGGGGGGVGTSHLKLCQPKCELSDDQVGGFPFPAPTWHWNRMPAPPPVPITTHLGGLLKKRGRKKKKGGTAAGTGLEGLVKEEGGEDWEVKRRKKKKQRSPNCASPKSKLVEYHEMTERLRVQPERFRLFNRGYYWGTSRNRKPTESEHEFLARIAMYEKFPGLIIDEEITRFNVCVECGVVTKNLSISHRCQTQVDFLRGRPVEMFRRIQKSAHLSKYFKQKAEKALCLVCSKLCPSIDAFQVHLKEEHNVEPLLYKANNLYGDYVCQECGKRLVNMNLLRQHEINKHAKIELARAKCEDCSAYFATANLYAKHVKTVHEDYRPHVCEDCARSFKVKKHLESHRRTHTGEKSFQCRHCDKSFAKEWTRTQHERLHLGLKPYQCEVCDAKYSQKTSLDCHVRTHHKFV